MTLKLSTVVSIACGLAIGACGDDNNSNDVKAGKPRRSSADAGEMHPKDADTGGETTTARTSRACGETPILSDYWFRTPPECSTCIESQCCAEAKACSDDSSCKSYRECLTACDASDGKCQTACYQANPPGDANGTLFTCEVGCATCLDFSCAGKPWKKATAESYDLNLLVLNFASGDGVPNAAIKVCEPADTACEHPLGQTVTQSDGSARVTVPAAGGGTDAYFEVTADSIISTLFYFHNRTIDLTGISVVQVLDTSTGNSLTRLSGGSDLTESKYGSLVVVTTTCDDTPFPGATISSTQAGADAVTSYLVDGLPSQTATKTGTAGIGEIVSHAPGKTNAKVMLGEKVLATAEVVVRAGYETLAVIPPGE